MAIGLIPAICPATTFQTSARPMDRCRYQQMVTLPRVGSGSPTSARWSQTEVRRVRISSSASATKRRRGQAILNSSIRTNTTITKLITKRAHNLWTQVSFNSARGGRSARAHEIRRKSSIETISMDRLISPTMLMVSPRTHYHQAREASVVPQCSRRQRYRQKEKAGSIGYLCWTRREMARCLQ